MDEKLYLTEFLTHSATGALVSAFQSAVGRADAAGTQTQLAHIVLGLLEDATVSDRISVDVGSKARAALSAQILELDESRSGGLGFKLGSLVEPARQLALDWGATQVSPLTFLATCLSAEVQLDSQSARTRESLRAAGLTVESLGARISAPDARRQDFTFKSLNFGTDITAMARAGFWPTCPLVGMERELRTLATLLNSGTGSVCIIGEPGVGKSAFIQGFAYRIAAQDRSLIPASMDSWTIVMIESSDILQGMGGQGELEGRVHDMISFFRGNPTVIPFFEEIHRLLDSEDSAAKKVATALKPPMANGVFRCVGCTTDKEYARYIASDQPMDSRFRKVLLPEPDHETARKIILGSKANLLRGRAKELGLDISPEGVAAAVSVTATYQRNDRLPRKAINLLGAAVSEKVYKIDMATGGGDRVVGPADVARLFSEISGIPVDALDSSRPGYYQRLGLNLNERVKGQRQAIEAVVSLLALHSRGWLDKRRPRGRFLFMGPPGVGKTELALALAAEVMRDRGSLIVLNMADYQGEGARNKFMGADPGYTGFGQTPTIYSRVMMRPFSVVVLDEFEKADPVLSNPLLSILDGSAEDSQGRLVDFSQCIFVMTSNALIGDPNNELSVKTWQGVDAVGSEPTAVAKARDVVDETFRQLLAAAGSADKPSIWTPPLLDRIDRVCLFRPLGRDVLLDILGGLIATRGAHAASPLPVELDDPAIRAGLLDEATVGQDSASARRLDRTLLRWLTLRAESEGVVAEATAAAAAG